MQSLFGVVSILSLTCLAAAQTTWLDAPQELLPPSFGTPVRFALADVDKDGDMDLVEVRKVSPYRAPLEVRFLLGDKSGGFRLSTAPFCKREVVELEFADLDGDGDQDLLTLLLLPNSGTVGWHFAMYENDGKGLFKEHLWIHPTWGAVEFALADVDGDGDLYIHAFSARSNQDRLFLNNGKARFTDVTGAGLPTSTWGAEFGIVGDFDGDKDADLIRVDAQRAGARTQLHWGYWENDGKGRFKDRTATNMSVQPGRTGSLWREAMDADQDGDLDLLVMGAQPYFLLNDGKGKFTAKNTLALPKVDWFLYQAATILDVDGNGLKDLLFAYESMQGNARVDRYSTLLLNQGKGQFKVATTSVLGGDKSGLVLAKPVDLDGDGDQDLVGGQYHGLRLRFNDGKAHLLPDPGESMPRNGGTHYEDVRFSVPVDVDGDGDLDLVAPAWFIREDRRALYLWRNDGSGHFKDESEANMPKATNQGNYAPRSVTSADVDGDGDMDLITGGTRPEPLVLQNDGKGKFTRLAQSTSSTWRGPVVVADFDKDGDLDFVTQRGRIWINDGKGSFGLRNITPIWGTKYPGGVVHGLDIDGDKDVDLFVTYHPYYTKGVDGILVRNDGGFKFTVVQEIKTINGNPARWKVVDVNRDGVKDLVEMDLGIMLLGDGKGKYLISPKHSFAKRTWIIDIGDLDGDGWPDVLVPTKAGSSPLGPGVRLWDPKKQAYVDATSSYASARRGASIYALRDQLLDVDGDGDLDLVPPGVSRRILFNLHRQLMVRGTGGAGKPVDLLIYSDVGDVAVPVLGTGRTRIQIPGLGNWYLSGTLLALPVMSLKQQGVLGHAGLRLQIPASKALIGQPIWAQALLLGKKSGRLDLTNAYRLGVRGL